MPSLLRRRRKPAVKIEPRNLSPLFRLWALRMLVRCGGQSNFIHSRGFMNDQVAEALGISHLASDDDEFSPSAARAALRKQLTESEKQAAQLRLPAQLARNAEQLGALVGLDETARQILGFTVLLKSDATLNGAADLIGSLSLLRTVQTVAIVLGLPESAVKASLAPEGTLQKSGLLRLDRRVSLNLDNKFDLLSDGFAEALQHEDGDPLSLLGQAVRASPPGKLTTADYQHLGDTYPMLEAYVRHALARRHKGVNILIWGPPGTGKTELARLLSHQAGTALMEVVCADADGDPLDGEQRVKAYRAAQWVFARKPSLILFDEIEDVFNDTGPFSSHRSFGQARKGWINSMLEENPVPALWLSNAVSCLDEAFIRRFDLVIEVPVPPKSQRKAIIARSAEGLLEDAAMTKLAEAPHVPPAVIARAAGVARVITRETPSLQPSVVMERLIEGTLKAQGHRLLGAAQAVQLPEIYDPAFVNADIDLAALAQGLKASGSGRICLYGPPGTGKTAYGSWLAGELEKPLIVKRASDLLSMYVGGTEKAIAEAFAQAKDEEAVLMIDEVDSFLQDRRAAHRSWELTQVNELLTQMEVYDGIFIASTNLMDGMDQAALRRFDVKAQFGYLSADQAFGLLALHCAAGRSHAPDDNHKALLRRLEALTPGDFAAVARRSRFQTLATPDAWIAALEQECAFKHAGKTRIGFN